ncbi:hypothetical protein QZH41_013320 [Actinostola sp. cb2023]|nr:hypothetical protein QZH41_013320 [Actinostola sp. cb2023]
MMDFVFDMEMALLFSSHRVRRSFDFMKIGHGHLNDLIFNNSQDLLEKDRLLANYNEVTECTWPVTSSSEFVIKNSDGAVNVKSLDGYATLTLSSHGQTFSVCYLAEVPPEVAVSQGTQKSKEVQAQYLYTWLQTADQSIQDCPEYWIYPLKVALAKRQDKHTTEELSTLNNVSKLPKSLPVTCRASHLHRWMLKDQE